MGGGAFEVLSATLLAYFSFFTASIPRIYRILFIIRSRFFLSLFSASLIRILNAANFTRLLRFFLFFFLFSFFSFFLRVKHDFSITNHLTIILIYIVFAYLKSNLYFSLKGFRLGSKGQRLFLIVR